MQICRLNLRITSMHGDYWIKKYLQVKVLSSSCARPLALPWVTLTACPLL